MRPPGISAPPGGTTVSQFFEIAGLKKFALSATDGVFDVLRYDNSGAFLDRPLRILRSGNIETTVSLDVGDSAVGSGTLGLTGDYVQLEAVSPPTTPASAFGRLFLDSSNGEVSVKKPSGSTVSLEQGGGGTGDVSGPASSTDNALARFDGTDGKTVQASGVTVDDSNNLNVPGSLSIGIGSTAFNLTGYTDDVAPAAPGMANQFTAYVDRSSGSYSWIINGGTAQTALTTSGTQTVTGKTIDGDDNTLQDIPTTALDTVAIAQGGTGQTTQTAAMDALSPSTTKGDILVDNGTSVIRLPVGTNGQALLANSALSAGVEWGATGGSSTAYHWQTYFVGSVSDNGTTLDATGGASWPNTSGSRPTGEAAQGNDWGVVYTILDNTGSDYDYLIVQQYLPSTFTNNINISWTGRTDSVAAATGNLQIKYEYGCVTFGDTNSYPASSTTGLFAIVAPDSENNDALIGESGALDISSKCTAGDMLYLRVGRDDSEASDTYEDQVVWNSFAVGVEY